MKNRYLVSLLSAFSFLLTSCAEFPATGYAPGTTANRGGTSSSAPRAANIFLKITSLSGGGKDLYAVINGRDYYLKRVRAFNGTPKGQYTRNGIPGSAAAAGTFWDSQEEEDAQGLYVADNGSHVSVYTGYYTPGAMHDVRWKLLRTIKF